MIYSDPAPTSTRVILHKVNEQLFPLLRERGILASQAEQTLKAEQVGKTLDQLNAYFNARSPLYCFITPDNELAFILGQGHLLIHFSTEEVGQLLLNELVDRLNLKATWESEHRFVVVKSC